MNDVDTRCEKTVALRDGVVCYFDGIQMGLREDIKNSKH